MIRHTGVLIPVLALALAGTTVAQANNKPAVAFDTTEQSATISTSNGYPAVGGHAIQAAVQTTRPMKLFADGAEVITVTITGFPSPSKVTFKGTGVLFFTHGTVDNTFTGTTTVHSDGSTTSAGHGRFTGGTGRYQGATGRFTFTNSAASPTAIQTTHTTGTISI